MGRIGNSWRTVKESWGVLRKDKELIFFPVLSGIASLIVIASFLAPAAVSGVLDRAAAEDQNAQIITAVLYVAMHLLLAFVTIYFNSALVFAATERLKGGDPNISSGLRGANKRLGAIFAWAMFAGTVNLILQLIQRALRNQNNMIGAFIVGLVGTAWNLAIYFAVPVVLFEDKGVFASLKRSGQLFKQRWGESLVGEYGIGFVFGILAFLIILVAFLMVFMVAPVSIWLALGIVVVAVVALVIVGITGAALGAVYKAALYHYAASGRVADEFSDQVIQNAYRSNVL